MNKKKPLVKMWVMIVFGVFEIVILFSSIKSTFSNLRFCHLVFTSKVKSVHMAKIPSD